MKKLYNWVTIVLPTWWYCLFSGLKYQKTWSFQGKPRIIKRDWLITKLLNLPNGRMIIGKGFKCNNKLKSNSIGLIQPCVFNISTPDSQIILGNNVGISGSTICAAKSVSIGNNVLIGSGCLITDTDAHPIDWLDRREDNKEKIGVSPIVIGDDVFLGARSIILKGVTIGDRSIVGAGSVVVNDVPSDCVVAGNPAKIVKYLKDK